MLWRFTLNIDFLNSLETLFKISSAHSIHIRVLECLKLYDWHIGDKYYSDFSTSMFGLLVYPASLIMNSWTSTFYISFVASFNFSLLVTNKLWLERLKNTSIVNQTRKSNINIYKSSFKSTITCKIILKLWFVLNQFTLLMLLCLSNKI